MIAVRPTAPLLCTARLELWLPQAGDMDGLHACTESPRARAFIGGGLPDTAESFARLLRNGGSWALHGYGMFTLRLTEEERIIGSCGVFRSWRGFGQGFDDAAEAGWSIHPDFWGQGLAGEAMQAVMAWFDTAHGDSRTVCMIEEGHAASDRLARSLGFQPFGRHEETAGEVLILYDREHPTSG